MTDYEDFMERYRRERAAAAAANANRRALVFDALEAAGVTCLTVDFDGEGDGGQLEDVVALAGEQLVELPTTPIVTQVPAADPGLLTSPDQSLRATVEDLCYEYLEEKEGGWENNDGAYGEFRFDVTERTIELEFNARFTDVNTDIHNL